MHGNTAWFSRVYREYEAGNLTPLWRDVLKALGRFDGCRFGIFPSHALLAAHARCSIRTVQNALRAARELGLLEWCHQRVRRAWRSLRGPNRYVLRLPDSPVATTGKLYRRVTQPKQQEASEGRSGGLKAMLEAAATLPDLLKARREAMEARWRARHGIPAAG